MSELAATCEVCRSPVDTGTGYLWVNVYAASDVQKAAKAWSAEHDGPEGFTAADVMLYPEPARWRVHHQACDPDRDCYAYSIDIERVATTEQLLWWTSHLMGKAWLEHTDWQSLIEGVANGNDARLAVQRRAAA